MFLKQHICEWYCLTSMDIIECLSMLGINVNSVGIVFWLFQISLSVDTLFKFSHNFDY